MTDAAAIAALEEANRALVAENERLGQQNADLKTLVALLKDRLARALTIPRDEPPHG
jgi:uncharacterized coiled-coil protein SlyX